MTEEHLKSWKEFAPLIREIRDKYGVHSRTLPDGSGYERENNILFRGQCDSQWELKTTLERKSSDRFDVLKYWIRANRCVNELESFTGKRWETKTYPEVGKEIAKIQDSMRVHLPHYDYLIYLRHHGFPSPLLDWTESPYIAAYFAYCEDLGAERVALYAYIERPEGGKAKRGGAPMITVEGPYVTTDARHFVQKAWYTYATEWSTDLERHDFCHHEKVLRSGDASGDAEQDVLVKITLPRTERIAALRDLNDHNINHFTLFQSEDSLVKAMAMKQFDLMGT